MKKFLIILILLPTLLFSQDNSNVILVNKSLKKEIFDYYNYIHKNKGFGKDSTQVILVNLVVEEDRDDIVALHFGRPIDCYYPSFRGIFNFKIENVDLFIFSYLNEHPQFFVIEKTMTCDIISKNNLMYYLVNEKRKIERMEDDDYENYSRYLLFQSYNKKYIFRKRFENLNDTKNY